MKKKVISVFASVISIFLLAGCAGSGTGTQNENAFVSGDGVAIYVQPAKRMPAPNIDGPTLSGATFHKNSKITVVNVWASWCAPCRAEAPLLEDFAMKNEDLQFVGVLTRDNTSAALSFINRYKITYPILIDDSVLAGFKNSLVPNAIPTTIIIDQKGKVAVRISGEATFALLDSMISKVKSDA